MKRVLSMASGAARARDWPRALYVHVPYCRRRCPYCDFYFVVGKPDPRFVDAIARELDARAAEMSGPLASIAFGGGTPSVLSGADIAAIIAHARGRYGLDDDAEITLEANPEDLSEARVDELADAGVTRVSVGVQSFDDEVLRSLGRGHDGAGARAAIARLVSRVARVSLDLIIGVPGERPRRLDDDIEGAHALDVGHVSTYLLTVEEGTPLERLVARGARAMTDDDGQAEAYRRAQALLVARGYAQYEVSSFARPGEESRHNRIYWGKGEYLGLGPGAHSMAIDDEGGVVRRANARDLARWLAEPTRAVVEEERLVGRDALREAIAFGLRDLGLGVDLSALAARHQCDVDDEVRRALSRHAHDGLVVLEGERVRLTGAGALFADRVARDVLVP